MSSLLWEAIEPGLKQLIYKIDSCGLEIPVSLIGGASEGQRLLITTGVHGSEYPATAAVSQLARKLNPAEIKGQLLMIHPLNTSGFKARVANIMPEDGNNLNRMFPGDAEGSFASQVAWWLTQHSDAADFYLDLHSGDLYEDLTPYLYYPGNASPEVVAKSKAAALVVDVPYMVKSGATTGAYNSAALRGTPALLLERGAAGRCLNSEIEAYKKDLLNLMKHLGVLDGEVEARTHIPVEMEKVIYLESKHSASWLAKTTLGQTVKKGQLLGRVTNFFGEVFEEFYAEMDGVVLYQTRPLSTNPGDVLVAYGN